MWIRMSFEEKTMEGKRRAAKRRACEHDRVMEMKAFGTKTILSCSKCDAMWEEIG
jgi:hypothetical protein